MIIRPQCHATKKGNAQLNNMNDISIASLSYIATLVHFGLSSQGTFNVDGDLGRFDYLAFYCAIVDLLSHERMVPRREALLRWWKGCLNHYAGAIGSLWKPRSRPGPGVYRITVVGTGHCGSPWDPRDGYTAAMGYHHDASWPPQYLGVFWWYNALG
ncbi:hypothetical protein JB92DRAFT_2834899 [Gautieria morchelliformis]|nr:hypothetical protein JB92DRAFT_2834899 [Gautieria morchelliformis]